MRSNTVICLYWKLTGRIEVFINLGKLFRYYDTNDIGISRSSLNKKDLFFGYENEIIRVVKSDMK